MTTLKRALPLTLTLAIAGTGLVPELASAAQKGPRAARPNTIRLRSRFKRCSGLISIGAWRPRRQAVSRTQRLPGRFPCDGAACPRVSRWEQRRNPMQVKDAMTTDVELSSPNQTIRQA